MEIQWEELTCALGIPEEKKEKIEIKLQSTIYNTIYNLNVHQERHE